MSQKEKPQVSKTMFIHIAIGIILMFAGWFIPPFASITELGMKILFIFIGVIYLWSTVETTWSSCLAVILVGMSGYTAKIGDTITSGFGNTTVVLVLFSMILFGGLIESGVAKYIARFFLTRKISNGRPYVFTFIFTIGLFVVSLLTNVFATLMLAWPIAYAILNEVGYTKEDKFAKFFVFCAFLGSIFGQITIPFRGSKIAIFKGFENAFGSGIDFLMFMVFDAFMAVVLTLILLFLCKFVYKCDVSKMKNFSVDYFDNDPLPKMNNTQKYYLAVCFLYILCMLLPNVLDATIPVVAFLNKLGTTGITIAWVIASCIIHFDGKPALDFKQVSAKHVQWNVIMLVVVAIMMSSALTSEGTGIKPLIMSVLTPILGGHSMWMTGCLMMLVGFILTNVANNFVCAMVMLPLFGTFAAETAMDPVTAAAIACASIVCLYMAFLTPAASPYAGMLFSNTDWFTPADIMKFAVPFSILLIAAFFFIGYPVALFLFGLVA